MGDFFKGWRREFGVLMLACVFMAGWVRSQYLWDSVMFLSMDKQSRHAFSSSPKGITYCLHLADFYDSVPMPIFWTSPWSDYPGADVFSFPGIEWSVNTYGFRYGYYRNPWGSRNIVFTVWSIPYWSLVIPLTLLSAWLLLVKLRKKEYEST